MTLWLRRVAPEGRARGKVLLTHAMMANGGYLVPFAERLAWEGIESWVLDFRGHGRSVPPDPRATPGWSFDAYVERDLPAAVGLIGDDYLYLGHSLGGLAGVAAFGTGTTPPPRRMCLVATTSVPRAGRAVSALFAATARLAGYLPVTALGIGSDDEPEAYALQLADWYRTRRWTSSAGADYADAAARVTVPALAVIATRDLLTNEEDQRAFASRLGGPVALQRVPVDHFGFFRAPAGLPWNQVVRFFSQLG